MSTSRTAIRAVGLLTVCVVTLAALSFTPAASAFTSQSSVLLFGSSSMNGAFGHLVADELEKRGMRVARHGYAAAGLARPDFRDLRKTLDGLKIDESTSTVMMLIGGNDGQSLWSPAEQPGGEPSWIYWQDDRWPATYQARAVAMINALCSRHVKHVIMLAPVDVLSSRLQGRLVRVRSLLHRAARASVCGHFISTAGDEKEFVRPGAEPLRAGDGVHMTQAGARRVWERIRGRVFAIMADTSARVEQPSARNEPLSLRPAPL